MLTLTGNPDPDVGGRDKDDERGGKLAPGRDELLRARAFEVLTCEVLKRDVGV
jgi:hypothetical protein